MTFLTTSISFPQAPQTQALTRSLSDLIMPSIGGLLDSNVSPVSVAKDLMRAAGTSAGRVSADVAVPDAIESFASLVGAQGLLAKYGPGRAASAITEPLIEKLVAKPIMEGCMAVLAKYSAVLSLTITGITALQVGVAAAAGIGVAYAFNRFFKK
jgi:hypothetical protein